MTTDRQAKQQPHQRPSKIKTTQRVVERCDWDDGVSDVYFDLMAHEVVPRYENETDDPPRGGTIGY